MEVKLVNLGMINQNKVIINDLTLFFSYETIVAFRKKGKLYCSKNVWSRTTGKMLNDLCSDKKRRLEFEEFEKELEKVLKK